MLPHGILPRLITRTHALSTGQPRWRSGVVLVKDGAGARLQADYDASTLTIWVRGSHAQARRELLTIIRHECAGIHSRIEGLDPEEKVAVPGHPEVLIAYRDVILDERRRKTTFPVTVRGRRVDWPIHELLDGVESFEERRQAARAEKEAGRHLHIHGDYFEGDQNMNHDQSIHIGGDNYGQVAQTMTNCVNTIHALPEDGKKTDLLALEGQVCALLERLPSEKQ